MRVGATSRVADEDTLRELEFTGAGKSFDSQICRGMAVSQREIDRLCSAMHKTARANCENADEKRGIRKVTPAQLEDWGVLARRGEDLLPTYAFALLSGSRKFWTEIQCAVFRGETKAVFIDRREFTGSVFKQIDAAFDYALSKINMGMELRGINLQFRIWRPEWSDREKRPERPDSSDSQKSSQKSSQKIRDAISENPDITTNELAEMLGITRRAVAKHMASLQSSGTLRRIGPDKGGHWEVMR